MRTKSARGYTWAQRDELWARHLAGESRRSIARQLGKLPGSVHDIIRNAGGIAPRKRTRSDHALSLTEREVVERALARGASFRAIGAMLARAPSSISREIGRHGGRARYAAVAADAASWRCARRPKVCRLATRPALCELIASKLLLQWSPKQIQGWLLQAFPAAPEWHVSHETIYRSLYLQARGVLKKELTDELRRGRVARRARTATRKGQGRGQIVDAVSISERPPEAADRAVPGHWEGDLLAGGKNSYIATLVERSTRFVILVKVPSKETTAVVPALAAQIERLPVHLKRSMTWDRGTEMAHHARFTVETGVQVFFCDPQSPWQRGRNENTNGLLRQYFPKGAPFANVSQQELDVVADRLNGRPRQTLGFQCPAEVYDKAVASIT